MNLIPVMEFSKLYGVSEKNIYSMSKKNSPEWIKKIGSTLMIDSEYLIEHQEWSRSLWLMAHDYYYYFTYVMQVPQFVLAQVIAEFYDDSISSWSQFMQIRLFNYTEKSLIHLSVPQKLIMFVELSEILIKKLHIRLRSNKKYQCYLRDMI